MAITQTETPKPQQTGHNATSQDAVAPAVIIAKKQSLPEMWDKDEIVKRQDGIKTALTSLDGDVHTVLVQIMMHVKKHRDTTLMRRFLFDIITTDSGYRRAGIIAWMRSYSPMELVGENVKLTGKDPNTGKERPFRIIEAMNNPFRSDDRFKEQLQPFFVDNIRTAVSSYIKKGRAALANVKDGQPVDKTKLFFDGQHPDKVAKALDALELALQGLPADDTKARRKAEAEARELGLTVIENVGHSVSNGDKKQAA